MHRPRINRRAFLQGSSAAVAACVTAGGKMGVAKADETAQGLRLTTFRCDVTPPLGTPIYSSYRPLEVVEYPLLAKGIVLESGGERYVLCAVDWCELRNSTYDLFRRLVAEAAQTDVSRVAVQTVHQHTAPLADGDASVIAARIPNPPAYPALSTFEEPAARLADAVKASLAQWQSVDRMGLGQGKVEQVASNRRVPIGDGKVGFRASSCKDPAFQAQPEGLIDPFLKTITFSQGDKPLARLHYYATHPQSFYGDPRASYDFAGIARERLEAEEGVFQVYFTGCAGDVAAGKYNDGTPPAREQLANRLFAGMQAAIAATEYAPAPAVEWRVAPVTFAPRNDAGYTAADGRAELADETRSAVERMGGAIGLAWRERADKTIELSAMRLGKACVLHLPGEPMIAYQYFAQETRPDLFVAVSGYSDCATGYICLERSFPEGGYEPTASTIVPESETILKQGIRDVLNFT